MSNEEYRDLLKNALDEIRRLRSENASLGESRTPEPIAILGYSCRFPGAKDPDAFWKILHEGTDCIQRVPRDRWDADHYFDADPDRPGKMVTRFGGFLEDIRSFDAPFFSISSREARSMDPQQRLLLEVTWEALERSAISPESIYDRSVGVFLGIANSEYATLMRQGEREAIDGYFGTGNAPSVAAGRLAYFFGLHGPTVALDTACSSSLVAAHFAVQSLRQHESELAIVGGVNAMLIPETSIHFSNARMLAPDGRCKPFSSLADGYGRSEGCGVVILKRLSDAIRDRDPISALLRGTAINHDGRSAGLTAPHGPSQDAVLQAALSDSRLKVSDVVMIEAHGTGTPLGDPIEAGSIARVYGKGRTVDNPIYVTSVKSNVGHMEAAAGVAGLIKACLVLEKNEIPALLHHQQRSQHIPSETLAFPSYSVPLASNPSQPIAVGISSFGFSGTNAHLILQKYHPDHDVRLPIESPSHNGKPLMVLSAKTEQGLSDLVQIMADWFSWNKEADWHDLCYTLQIGRSHFSHRLALMAENGLQAEMELRGFAKGNPYPTADDFRKDLRRQESWRTAAIKYLHGDAIDWASYWEGLKVQRIRLPTYPFQRQPYWVSMNQPAPIHATNRKTLSESPWVEMELQGSTWTSVEEHRVFGAPLMPAVGWIHAIQQISIRRFGKTMARVEDLRLTKALLWPPTSKRKLSFRFESSSDGSIRFLGRGISEIDPSQGIPESNIEGTFDPSPPGPWLGGALNEHRIQFTSPLEVEKIYRELEGMGFDYGPSYRRVSEASMLPNRVLAQLDSRSRTSESTDSNIDLGLWDSSLHGIAAAVQQSDYSAPDPMAFLPVGIGSIEWFALNGSPAWSLVEIKPSRKDFELLADVFIWDRENQPIAQLLGVRLEGWSLASSPVTTRGSSLPQAEPKSGLTIERWMATDPNQRFQTLQHHLREQLAQELEIPFEALQPKQPLAELGLDSLMVFRLGLKLESELGVMMEMRNLLEGPSLEELTKVVLEKLEQRSLKNEIPKEEMS